MKTKLIRIGFSGDDLICSPDIAFSRRVLTLALDSILVELVIEDAPIQSWNKFRRFPEVKTASHIPGPLERYETDTLLSPQRGQTRRAVAVLILKERLNLIRSRFPLARITVPEAEKALTALPDERQDELHKPGERDFPRSHRDQNHPAVPSHSRRIREVFRPRRKRPADILLPLSVAVFLAVSSLIPVTLVRKDKETASLLFEASRLQESRIAAETERKAELSALENQWQNLVRGRPRRPTDLLAALAEAGSAGSDSGEKNTGIAAPATASNLEITYLSVDGRGFRFKGRSSDPMALVRSLRAHPRFSGINAVEVAESGGLENREISIEGLFDGP